MSIPPAPGLRRSLDGLRNQIARLIALPAPTEPPAVVVHDEVAEDGYTRKLVSYDSGGASVQAFLFQPLRVPTHGAGVALHYLVRSVAPRRLLVAGRYS